MSTNEPTKGFPRRLYGSPAAAAVTGIAMALVENGNMPRVFTSHPLEGMKGVPLKGDERQFKLSEAAQRRHDLAKKAKANMKVQKFKRKRHADAKAGSTDLPGNVEGSRLGSRPN